MSETVMRVEKEKASVDTAVRGANQTVRQENRTGIPTQLKERMEQSTGLSLDDVRVHYHSPLPAKLNALAYTMGNRVEIAPGQERHLSHELGHVVQQKLGMVRANATHSSGVALNTEARLERQADEIGAGKKMSGSVLEQSPVVQMYAPKVVCDDEYLYKPPVDEVEPGASKKPIMVFESMGTNMDDCKEIYAQTCRYEGNTICVFGLNLKGNLDSAKAKYGNGFDPDVIAGEMIQEQDEGDGADRTKHLLYVFAFAWQPLRAEDNSGYEMPFVEARLLIMDKASHIISNLLKWNHHKILYRWIDADARNDTSNDVSSKVLNSLARNKNAKILTGRYDWRHADSEILLDDNNMEMEPANYEDDKLYDLFLIKMNQAEKELRDFFHYLSTFDGSNPDKVPDEVEMRLNERHMEERAFQGKSGIYKGITNRGLIPGYYLPETAFMMNQKAHENMVKRLKEELGNLEENKSLTKQDKESMRSVGVLLNTVIFRQGEGNQNQGNQNQGNQNQRREVEPITDLIIYDSHLSVQKPLKNEYILENRADRAKTSYLGSVMLGFLSEQEDRRQRASRDRRESPQLDEAAPQVAEYLGMLENGEEPITEEESRFIDALNNIRQSAFSKWYFISDQNLNKWELWRFKYKKKEYIYTKENFNYKDIDKYKQKWLNIKKCNLEMRLWEFLNKVSKNGSNNGSKTVLTVIREKLNGQIQK